MSTYDTKFVRRLSSDWTIQSSTKIKQTGDAISQKDFNIDGWYPAFMPSTVLAVLVENGVYEDPYFGMNLKKIPE